MRITKKLREHLVAKAWAKADAPDDTVKSVALEKIGCGELAFDEIATLTKEEDPDDEKTRILTKALQRLGFTSPSSDGKPGLGNPSQDDADLSKLVGAAASGHARVNKATERMGFSTEKSAALWEGKSPYRAAQNNHLQPENKLGSPMYYWERKSEDAPAVKKFLDKPSKAEYAKMGAVFKYKLAQQVGRLPAEYGNQFALKDYDLELVQEALNEDSWVGESPLAGYGMSKSYRGEKMDDISKQGWLTKAVLEATGDASGGEQAVPQYFDFEAIRIPLLYGELLPWVELVPTDRGKAAHSYSILTPTFVTTTEGSAVTPFTTTAFVATFDASFFPATCAFEWGRDFEADSAPNFGEIVMAQLGDQAKKQIDIWIATGDGTTQPQGIMTASGVSVSAAGANTHTSMVYNDLLNLAYGLGKAQRLAFGGDSTRYAMGDAQYKKVMQIATGVTGDTRPIFGMAIKDYRLGDYGVSINDTIAAGQLAFCNLRGYRLYQRKGLYFDLVTTGRTLALSQTKLLVARMRYGGKLVLTGANGYVAQMTNADAR